MSDSVFVPVRQAGSYLCAALAEAWDDCDWRKFRQLSRILSAVAELLDEVRDETARDGMVVEIPV